MTYRIRRKFTSHTFMVGDQICKIFLEPFLFLESGICIWNIGFAVGKSNRQINDWFNKRKNRRGRRMTMQITGKQGIKTITEGFKTVLRMRWKIPSGDGICLDCTSADPRRQFRAWSHWCKKHPEWIVDSARMEFYWFRPPYIDDPIREDYQIIEQIPNDPLANTDRERYYDCFLVDRKPEI